MNKDNTNESAQPAFCDDTTAAARRASRLLLVWSVLWAASLLLCAWIAVSVVISNPLLQLAVAAVPVILGLMTFWFFIRKLRAMDELQQRIQLEALGIGFAVGVLYEIGFTLYVRLADIQNPDGNLASVMLFAWIGAVLWGKRRYA